MLKSKVVIEENIGNKSCSTTTKPQNNPKWLKKKGLNDANKPVKKQKTKNLT